MVPTVKKAVKVKMKIFTMSRNVLPAEPGRAFTIAEMLLVVVIIALLATVAGGIYTGTYKKSLAETSARELLLAAKYARIVAVERQDACRMVLDTDENRFYLTINKLNEQSGEFEETVVQNLYFKGGKLRGDVEFEDLQIAPRALDQTVGLEEPRQITFRPNGTADEAVIQIGDGRYHYTVVISASTGKATVQFGTADEVKNQTIDLDE